MDYIIWAAPCLGDWLESLQSNEREELFNSYRAGHLNIELAKQPGATAQEVFLKAVKRKKSKAPPQGPKKAILEGDSVRRGYEVSMPMEQGQDQQPQVGSLQPHDNEPAPKVSMTSGSLQGPSEAEKLMASRRRVIKTWRNGQIKHGHWNPNHVQILVTSLKDTRSIQMTMRTSNSWHIR